MHRDPLRVPQRRRRARARLRQAVSVVPVLLAALPALSARQSATTAPVRDAGETAVSRVAAAPVRPVRVARADDAGVRLAYAAQDTAWVARDRAPGREPLWELALPEFRGVGAPGQPVLPSWGTFVLVPPGMRAQARPVREAWDAPPARALAVGPTPVARRDPSTGEEFLGAELVRPGEAPRTGRALPAADELAAKAAAGAPAAGLAVGEPFVWRGRRVAAVTLVPLAAGADGRAQRFLREGEWEIAFVPDAGAGGAAAAAARRGRGDARFASLFINPDGLERWPAQAPVAPRAPAPAPGGLVGANRLRAPLGDEVRLAVNQTRLHRLTAAGLQAAGLLPAGGVREDQIRLYQRRFNEADPARYLEVEVPVRVFGDGGDFTGSESVVFYGLRPRDDGAWTDTSGGAPVDVPGCGDPAEAWNGPRHPLLRHPGNIYWLAFGDPPAGEAWARMDEIALDPSAGAPLSGYRRTDLFEEDVAYREYTFSTDQDRCHWNRHSETAAVVTLPLYAADPAAGDARVRAGLIGFTSSANPRNCVVSLVVGGNTIPVGTVSTQSLAEVVASSGAVIPGAQLAARDATLRVVRLENPASQLFSYLDWVELSYAARYHAERDTLDFPTGEGAGDRDIEVTGFATSDLGVLDITNPHRPAWVALTAANLVDAGGSRTLSLRVPHPDGAQRRLLAQADVDGAGVAEFSYFNARRATGAADPTQAAGAPDVIVVAHGDFRPTLDRWVQYRRSEAGGGHEVHVVDVQDVYDWFSGGLRDPWAIRRFCRFAIDAWGSGVLVLVGDANENPRALGVNDATYDWVPTRLHAQSVLPPPEALASDKWFAAPDPVAGFPDTYQGLAELIVGRFPCNTPEELGTMIDKTLAAEAGQAGQPWRRRAIFVADDAFSYGYSTSDSLAPTLLYTPAEERFRDSEEDWAARWDAFAGGAQAPSRQYLATYLEPFMTPGQTARRLDVFRTHTANTAVPALLADLTQGALLVRYQGHANARVLAHEYMIQDVRANPGLNRQDVLGMNNPDRPWVYIGLGCHIAEWVQNTATHFAEPSLCERLLTHTGAAAASYGSSGYEFLDANANFADDQRDVWTATPPRPAGGRSRWVLGELTQAAEARTALRGNYVGSPYRELAAQYVLLGDPLLVLDCGPPELAVTLDDEGGVPLADGATLAALDSTNVRRLRLEAVDEAGVDRVVVRDSGGADPGATVTELPPPDPATDQRTVWEVSLPVRPFDHALTLHVYDTSDRTTADDHGEFTVLLPQTAAIRLAGQPDPIEPGSVRFVPGVPLDFTATFGSAAWIGAGAALQLTGQHLDLSGVSLTRRDPRTLDVAFTAVAPDDAALERAVTLGVDGYATTWVLQEGEGPADGWQLSEVLAFPNPASGPLRFLFRTSSPPLPGRVVVYSVSGRRVRSLPFGPDRIDGQGRGLVAWDGRDGEGDGLANGVYLFRVELVSPDGDLRSGMQRLVVMR